MLYCSFVQLIQQHSATPLEPAKSSSSPSPALPLPSTHIPLSSLSISRPTFHKMFFSTPPFCLIPHLTCHIQLISDCWRLLVAGELDASQASEHAMVESFFALFDVDRSGDIDFCEFVGTLASLVAPSTASTRLACTSAFNHHSVLVDSK